MVTAREVIVLMPDCGSRRNKLWRSLDNRACWSAVVRRDREADGAFFYSVRTTGVFCRPSCISRLARRENVNFHSTVRQARLAGFRPCKRCRPDQPSIEEENQRKVIKACRIIERAVDDAPDLDALARAVGLSKHHFHRMFKKCVGVTPKGYAVAHRAKRVREKLANGESITTAIYAAGFNSNARFYAKSTEYLGMKPSNYRDRGVNNTIHFAVSHCALGSVLVAATKRGVCAVLFGDEPEALLRDLQDRFSRATLKRGTSAFDEMVTKVIRLLEHPSAALDLPLDVRDTAFQQRVWSSLRRIPAGTTSAIPTSPTNR